MLIGGEYTHKPKHSVDQKSALHQSTDRSFQIYLSKERAKYQDDPDIMKLINDDLLIVEFTKVILWIQLHEQVRLSLNLDR